MYSKQVYEPTIRPENCPTLSCEMEPAYSDFQDFSKEIMVPKVSALSKIDKALRTIDAVHGSAVNENQSAKFGRKAVRGSANTNENLQNSFLRSELNIMQGERGGIQLDQHNTNQAKTRKKPSNNSATTAERDALDRDMDAITSKLGKILKMLKPMLASDHFNVKENRKQPAAIFNTKQKLRHKAEDNKDRKLPLKEDQGDQVRVWRRNVTKDFHADTTSPTTFQDAKRHPDRPKRNNRKDRDQAAMSSMCTGKEQGVRMRKDPINRHAGKAIAKNTRKTDVAATTFRRGQASTSSRTGGENIPVFYLYGTNRVPTCYGWNVSRQRHDDPTFYFGDYSTASSAQAMENEQIPSATKDSGYGALFRLDEQPTKPSEQVMLGATEVDGIPRHATVSNCGACINEFVTHDEGTLDDRAQRFPPSPGMDSDPSTPLETSIFPLSRATMGDDTASGTDVSRDSKRDILSDINRRSSKEPDDAYRNPQDPSEHVHLSTEEFTAMPVVAISSTDGYLIETIRIQFLQADVDYAIELDAGDIRMSPVYSKTRKEPDKTDIQCNEHEELDYALRRSIELSSNLCSNTKAQLCLSGQRNELPGPEPTTELVTTDLGIPVSSTQKQAINGPTTRSKSRLCGNCLPEIFRTPTATLLRPSATSASGACQTKSA